MMVEAQWSTSCAPLKTADSAEMPGTEAPRVPDTVGQFLFRLPDTLRDTLPTFPRSLPRSQMEQAWSASQHCYYVSKLSQNSPNVGGGHSLEEKEEEQEEG